MKIPKKYTTTPGHITVRYDKLYITYRGKRKATGLMNTPNNQILAHKKLYEMHLEYVGVEEYEKEYRLEEAFEMFLKQKCSNLKDKTIQNYKLAFKQIVNYNFLVSQKNIETVVNEFVERSSNLSSNTVATYLRQFEIFVNYLLERQLINKPVKNIKLLKPRSSAKPAQNYSDKEIELLFNYFKDKDYEFYLLMKVLLKTGLRISEALKLNWKQINGNRILIPNKINGNPEVAYIHKDLVNELRTLDRVNKIFRWSSATTSTLNKKLKQAMKELKIEPNGRAFHEFRKTFLNNLFKNDVPIEIAQKMMRHSDPKITINHYAKIDDSRIINNLPI